jgi:hypothetical protein
MAKQKFHFAKVQYSDDFYTYSSFTLTYSQTNYNISFSLIEVVVLIFELFNLEHTNRETERHTKDRHRKRIAEIPGVSRD